MMAGISISEHRAFDAIYDPVWKASSDCSSFVHGSKQSITANSYLPAMEEQRNGNEVSGKARYRFFYKPCSGFFVPANLKFAPAKRTIEEKREGPSSKTKGCQTDYRDSETQTDPYSPNYIKPSDSEVLALQKVAFKFGQTIQNSDVEMLERQRERNIKKARLPLITDERTLRIQKQEYCKARENEMNAIMQERLRTIERQIMIRDKRNKCLVEERIRKLKIQRSSLDATKQSFQRSRDIQQIRTQLDYCYRNDYRSPKSLHQKYPHVRSIQYREQDRKSVALSNDLKLIDSIVRSDSSSKVDEEASTQSSSRESIRTKNRKEIKRPATPCISKQCLDPLSTREGATILLQRIIRGTCAQKQLCTKMDDIVFG
uniref:Cilia- and flagella-associated protein 91 n=1 Tax=Leptocylindrus danicus TaxID=163516 RepID=A0A7S2KBU5_9STRA|mmetsp:Transcript_20370/g.30385  ORF Transcript_20370/g.30385 Transcript_20370/m.30385 type:complete len:373 (+) Transcript_20370:407-1525(+)